MSVAKKLFGTIETCLVLNSRQTSIQKGRSYRPFLRLS